MKLHHRFRPITFFFVGLLLGLGYIGASYIMHVTVLEKAGYRLSQEVKKYNSLKEEYDEALAKIDQLSTWSDDAYATVLAVNSQYESHYKSFQTMINKLVSAGKSHHLTFLDFQSEPSSLLSEIEDARVFTSSLSLGGAFKDIHQFLKNLKENNDPTIPLHKIEVIASTERNTQIKLTFKFIGELGSFLRTYEAAGLLAPQSFLILDPWSEDV
jgi:hypothetical protein